MNAVVPPLDFLSSETLSNPFAVYQSGLAQGPVHPIPASNITVVLGYAALTEALARVDDFSSDFAAVLAGSRSTDSEVVAILDKGWPQRNTLLTADPPDHTRFRKLVNLAFSMQRVDSLEERMRRLVGTLIEGFTERGYCEFVAEFAVPLPVQVIAEQIGIDSTDFSTVKRWSDAFTDRLGGMISRERELECAAEVVEFQHSMKLRIDDRRANPRDDLLSDLVNARVDGERPLDDSELMSILQQVMVAGNETTTSALTGGLLQLIRAPEQAAMVRDNPTLLPNLIEEVLRFESPTAGLWRVANHDTELAGVAIEAGTMLLLRFAAANRDPARFERPNEFDVGRKNARSHVAFGRGIHMCIGNMLSRKEMTVAFGELLSRLDSFEISDPAALVYPPNMLLRGLSNMPINFKKREAGSSDRCA